MAKSIYDRVDAAFSSEDEDKAKDYTEVLYEAWKDLTLAVRRTGLSVLLGMALFELLSRSAVEEFSIGPIKVKDLDLIEKVLPIVVGYLFYNVITQFIRWEEMESAYYKLQMKFHANIVNNDLEKLLYPELGSLIPYTRGFSEVSATRLKRLQTDFGFWWAMAYAYLLPIAFEIYAYFRLTQSRQIDPLFWISLLIAAITMIMYYTVLIIDTS